MNSLRLNSRKDFRTSNSSSQQRKKRELQMLGGKVYGNFFVDQLWKYRKTMENRWRVVSVEITDNTENEPFEKGLMFMGLIKMLKKIKKVSKKPRNYVRFDSLSISRFSFIRSLLVNGFIEEEMKNGISAERIVSNDQSIIWIVHNTSL